MVTCRCVLWYKMRYGLGESVEALDGSLAKGRFQQFGHTALRVCPVPDVGIAGDLPESVRL